MSVAPGQPSQSAVARHFARDVTLFDGGVAVRTLHTLYRPSALQLLSSSLAAGPGGGPLVAVAEGPQVSVWDVRGGGRGARVARLCPTPHHGHLYCLAVSDDGGIPLLGGLGWVGWGGVGWGGFAKCSRPPHDWRGADGVLQLWDWSSCGLLKLWPHSALCTLHSALCTLQRSLPPRQRPLPPALPPPHPPLPPPPHACLPACLPPVQARAARSAPPSCGTPASGPWCTAGRAA